MSEPAAPPPPPPPARSSNREVMIVLAYLGLLAVVPLVVEKEDAEVQWHAKHGLVLLAAELILLALLSMFAIVAGLVVPGGCVSGLLGPLLVLGIVVLHILCIVKGVGGERFLVPGVSQYADRF